MLFLLGPLNLYHAFKSFKFVCLMVYSPSIAAFFSKYSFEFSQQFLL